MTSHAHCTHEATKSARAACRRGGNVTPRAPRTVVAPEPVVAVPSMMDHPLDATQFERTVAAYRDMPLVTLVVARATAERTFARTGKPVHASHVEAIAEAMRLAVTRITSAA